ncbi:MAG: hypothetical protein N3C60_00415 [Calditerrivibrio sp.]|nr:hypothetical protein [Calditerrivibrio sp.]
MRLMVALIIVGLLLLYSTFYFGAIYFDGKVEKNTYEAAINYDKHKKLISDIKLDLSVEKISYNNGIWNITGEIRGKSGFSIKSLQVDSPSKKVEIVQKVELSNNNFNIRLDKVSEGNYVIVAQLFIDNESVRLEKPIYLKNM